MKEGTENSYANCHQKILRRYGNAKMCENPDCKYISPKRFEWALKKGRSYSTDINDYMQLCPSCHRKYDYTKEQCETHSRKMKGLLPTMKQISALNYGRSLTIKAVMQLSKDGELIKEWDSIIDAVRTIGVLQSSISNCLSAKHKTAGGFIWKLKN